MVLTHDVFIPMRILVLNWSSLLLKARVRQGTCFFLTVLISFLSGSWSNDLVAERKTGTATLLLCSARVTVIYQSEDEKTIYVMSKGQVNSSPFSSVC